MTDTTKEYLEKEKEINKKWLEYMNSVDVATVQKCPNGHYLKAYLSVDSKTGKVTEESEIVITCPRGGIGTAVDMCDYYDFSSFRVPMRTEMKINLDVQ